MITELCSKPKWDDKNRPAFVGLQVQVELHGTLAITTIAQRSRNDTPEVIEAVYSLHLPFDAVLLELTMFLGGAILRGVAVPKRESKKVQVDSIDSGVPATLEYDGHNTYNLNTGKLLPGEEAKICMRYATLLCWHSERLCYTLPCYFPPRYFVPDLYGQDRGWGSIISVTADDLFDFEMRLLGKMSGRAVESPSHAIAVEKGAEGKPSVVRLVEELDYLDRDLVIEVAKGDEHTASVTVHRDGDGYLLWGSFQQQLAWPENSTPRSITIVVDGSNWMWGDRIRTVRQALLRFLDILRPQDWFNIVVSWPEAVPLFTVQARANEESLSFAHGFLEILGASICKTNVAAALRLAARIRAPEGIRQDVVLITAHGMQDWEEAVEEAVRAGDRIFTVGVGEEVPAALVRALAERTGGAWETALPNEDLTDRIHRLLKRIYTPCSCNNKILWPQAPLRVYPRDLPEIYEGETCNFFAWFSEPPVGSVQLIGRLPDASTHCISAEIEPYDPGGDDYGAVSRIAAALELRDTANADSGRDIALKYQLLSRWTDYLAMVGTGENTDILPGPHRIEPMPAGWAELGGEFQRSYRRTVEHADGELEFLSWKDPHERLGYYLGLCLRILNYSLFNRAVPSGMNLPMLPAAIAENLRKIIPHGVDERTMTILFLNYIVDSALGCHLVKGAKDTIRKEYSGLRVDQLQIKSLEGSISGIFTPEPDGHL